MSNQVPNIDLVCLLDEVSKKLGSVRDFDGALNLFCVELVDALDLIYLDCYAVNPLKLGQTQEDMLYWSSTKAMVAKVSMLEAQIFDNPASSSLNSASALVKSGPIRLAGHYATQTQTAIFINLSSERVGYAWLHLVFPAFNIDAVLLNSFRETFRMVYEYVWLRALAQLRSAEHKEFSKRLDFYSVLLGLGNIPVKEAYPRIARAWLDAMDSLWIWLWIYNPFVEGWELLACCPDTKEFAPRQIIKQADRPIVEYVARNRKPLFVPNLDYQVSDEEGTAYSVSRKSEIQDRNCSTFHCVPIIRDSLTLPASNSNLLGHLPPDRTGILGAICVHYENGKAIPDHPQPTLELMANLTAFVLEDVYEKNHQRLLHNLNRLTEQYLTNTKDRPELVRRNYVQSLLALIREEMGCREASIFMANASETYIELLGTTGNLHDMTGKILTSVEKSTLRYRRNECLTGTVWSTAAPIVWKIGEQLPEGYCPKSCEIRLSKSSTNRQSGYAAVLYPIFRAPTSLQSSSSERTAVGVIRCAQAIQKVGGVEQEKNFDLTRLNALEFIATQIGPILETFRASIDRDHAVSRTKHDLESPADHVVRKVERLLKWAECALSEQKGVYSLILNQSEYFTRLPRHEIKDAFDNIKAYLEHHASVAIPRSDRSEAEEEVGSEATDQKVHPIDRTFAILKHQLSNIRQDAYLVQKLTLILGSEKDFLDTFSQTPAYLEGNILARLRAGFALSQERKKMRIQILPFRGIIPLLNIDAVFVERIFRNLIDNAIKYGYPNTDILVRPRFDPDTGYYVDVENDGFGISKEDSELIFTGTYRSRKAIDSGEPGHGIGLKTSQKMMEKHGGKIAVTHLSGPTTFTVFFPKNLAV